MPKAAKDTLLNTRTRPARTALADEYANDRDKLETLAAGGVVVWYVEVAPFTVPPIEPGDPYVEVNFQVAQYESGALSVIRWAITGNNDVRLSESSRFPLRTYARAAILAVTDALEQDAGLSYEQIAAKRRVYINGFKLTAGRLTDPRTHQTRTTPKRTYAHSRNGAGRLELHRVVDEYRKAIERGSRSPTVDVAHAFNVGRSTAARSLAQARRQGLLGAALRTRAGERPR